MEKSAQFTESQDLCLQSLIAPDGRRPGTLVLKKIPLCGGHLRPSKCFRLKVWHD